LVSELSFTQALVAESSGATPLHHMFNANLLHPGEYEASIVGNVRYGAIREAEIGTQAGALLFMRAPNVSFKYEMFHGSNFRTAFNAHLFYSRSDLSSKTSTESDENDSSLTADEPKAASSFLGYFGSVTTLAIDSQDYFSFGIYDFFMRQGWHELSRALSIHAISPTVGFDKYFGRSWAITAAIAYPVYFLMRDESDLADIKGAISVLEASSTPINPSIGFLTATYQGQTTGFEFGALFLAGNGIPYANVFWRFN
jgi:hypothetical protein